MIRIFATLFAALLGLAFGSFLNVCLTRWPAGESIVKPRSHCRSCTRTLNWWENIPLASWLALRGRCRTCGARISWRYPFVELAVGASWGVVAWQTIGYLFALTNAVPSPILSFSQRALIELVLAVSSKMVFTWVLVGLAALDAEHLWLPDAMTLPGIVMGITVTLLRGGYLVGDRSSSTTLLSLLLNVAFTILAAAAIILLIRWTYWLIRRREGMGIGDAKLMAMLAAWLGLPGALLSFAVGVVLAMIAAFVLLARPAARRGTGKWSAIKLPLGTFLSIGGIISVLWGQPIIEVYFRWAGL